MTSFGSKIAQKNSCENAQNIRLKKWNWRILFPSVLNMWKYHYTAKNISRIHCNLPGILQEILACIGVQITRIKGAISNKIQEITKSLRPTDLRPKPTDLMDPNQTNAPGALDWSRSIRIWIKRPVKGGNGPGFGSTRPSACIKGLGTRIPLFLSFSSLSTSLLRRLVLWNPNPSLSQIHPETYDSWFKSLVSSF